MSSTDRIRRLLSIISILQSGRFVNTRDLAEQCEVSRRTIFRDIVDLRAAGLQIEFDERQQGYQFVDRRFLLPTDLTMEEILALILICEELGDARKGIPYLDSARTAAFKLASVLPGHVRQEISKSIGSHHLQLDARVNLEGTDQFYRQLSSALAERTPVRIQYFSFAEQDLISTKLSPYCFYFSRRSWYVIGRSSIHKEIRTFHLNRIQQVEVLQGEHYEIPQRFSLENYFGKAWHMIRDKDHPYHVMIQFAPQVARNVAEVQWHKTQEIEERENGYIRFHVDVEGLDEIVWWVLGYGKNALVLEPPELQDKIIQHAQGILDNYRM